MTTQKKSFSTDVALLAAKREQQALSRTQVAQGQRTPESQFLISPKAAKAATVRHRVVSFG